MDLASILGIVISFTVVVVAIFLGGSISQFIDIPSMLIVIGGGMAATLIRFPLAGLMGAFATGGKVAFKHKKTDARSIIEKVAELADIGFVDPAGADYTATTSVSGSDFTSATLTGGGEDPLNVAMLYNSDTAPKDFQGNTLTFTLISRSDSFGPV